MMPIPTPMPTTTSMPSKVPVMRPYVETTDDDNENIELDSIYSPVNLGINIGYNNYRK